MQIWEIIKEIYKSNPNNKSPKEIANFLGVSLATVYRYQEAPEVSGVIIPTEKIIPLTYFTGDDRLLKFFANQCGYTLVKCFKNNRYKCKDIVNETNKIIKKFSDFLNEISTSLLDKKITKKEKEKIIKEGNKVIEQIFFILEVIKNEQISDNK
ncbi:MAG: helix-turn-helix domain-containing protein [Candidatus Omnitrophica bacterium]|nr:helix-turn-helix domain-containing protein [Candidatus Omnitrophota bacterium]